MTATPVYGCRYCGIELDQHGTRYHHRVGLHQWQGPTVDQIRARQGVTVPDGPWGGPVLVRSWPAAGGQTDGQAPPNRAARRKAARASRRAV